MTPHEYVASKGLVFVDNGLGPETDRIVLWEIPEIKASVHFNEVEPGNVVCFFHLDVRDPVWSVSLFRLCLKKWKEWLPTWEFFPMFTMADNDGLYGGALDRLREHFGFKHMRDLPCTDDRIRRLYCHFGA